jgi:3,4-dihydroxy 2-butanone 4-phosphate synthase / GTP cyclohydrolase II
MEGYGLSVTEQLPIQSIPNPHNEGYLRQKRDLFGHTLHHQGLPLDEELIHGEHQKEAEKGALGASETAEPAEGGDQSEPRE